MVPQFEVISHALCPLAHRLCIVGQASGLDIQRRSVSLATPRPQWFLNHSPDGAMPVLVSRDSTGAAAELDSRAALLQLLELGHHGVESKEIGPVVDRCDALLNRLRTAYTSPHASEALAVFDAVIGETQELARASNRSSATDLCVAPLAYLLGWHTALREHPAWTKRTHAWRDALLADPRVHQTLPDQPLPAFLAFAEVFSSGFVQALGLTPDQYGARA